MKRIAFYIALLVSFAACHNAVAAESLDGLFAEANNAFWNGEYDKAIGHYTKLEELGVRDPAVSYNLGTAMARVGRLGKAVLHYERVLRLEPSQEDARYNLSVIREHLARRATEAGRDADLAPAVTPWRAIIDRFSPSSAAIALIIFHIGLFGVLLIRRFTRGEMPRLTLGVLASVLAILTGTMLAVTVGKWHHLEGTDEAVVISTTPLDVMEGPGSEVKRFAIEEGSRVMILERQATWVHLLDSEDRDGWAPLEALGSI